MPKTSASSVWAGAPPLSEDGFAFANGVFFAQSSGQNQHRRATQAELDTHFTTGNDKDHPAHWFEAQLIHYGLPPSKTKSVARMRLFDAVKSGKLSVPTHLTKLEGKLKREWTKKDKEIKKGSATTKAAAPSKVAGNKRKAEVIVNVTVNNTASASNSSKPSVAKKAKTAKSSAPKKAAEKSSATSATKPATKQTARRGRISQGPNRQESAARSAPTPTTQTRPKQMARRSGAFVARGRIRSQPTQGHHNDPYLDESPPPYSEYLENSDGYGDDDDDDTAQLAPLGLINGRYDISCPFVESEWSNVGSDFSVVLTLAGSSLWGSFDLGIIEGVMHFEQRPMQSSYDPIPFTWRGRENEGPVLYGDGHEGWIKFLGNGRIQGELDYQNISFQGERIPGQGTRSETSARALQDEWLGYTEEEYERENRTRWR
ncbi:hypothetical protein PT974_01713 [Cladobotryum mycophilum]|uniref:Uncharacterized protein n=1 Tax=Cladobotryum mycophilum TaxID=491253 RepID=A0ABR0SWH8_9HYPO